MDTIDRILEQKNEQIKQLEEENGRLREELEELKEENRVKKINEYDEECTIDEAIKANTLRRDFSKQRIRELEEDIHMLRVENDMLRKKLRGEY